MQKPVWPPPEFDIKRPASAKETINNENNLSSENEDGSNKKYTSEKPLTQEQTNNASTTDILPLQPKSMNTLPPYRLANQLAREKFYNGTNDIVVIPQQHTPQQEQIKSSEITAAEKPMETEEK